MRIARLSWILLWALLAAPLCAFAADNGGRVARVYDTVITRSEITPSPAVAARVRGQLAPKEYAEWEDRYQRRRLNVLVWRAVQDRVLQQHHIEPSAAEVQALVDYLQEREAHEVETLQDKRDRLQRVLDSMATLEPRVRKQYQARIATLDGLIAHAKQRRAASKDIPNYAQLHARSLKRVAVHTVRQWKFNKFLYEKYGGRVIFQQAGLEPVDAYVKLIALLRADKAVEVYDQSHGDPFAQIEAYVKSPHAYIKKEEAQRYFARPWWTVEARRAVPAARAGHE